MKIGGLHKVSLIDYPGKISAVIFTQGCNFRCSYCHNPELVDPALFQPCLDEKDILSFLSGRRGKLDAVTVTGGEPTIQTRLFAFLQKIRKMDYFIKLDSNGSNPDVIERLIQEKLIDFIALDVKGTMEKYSMISKMPDAAPRVRESIRIILKAPIEHEFRTTVVSSLVELGDLEKMVSEMKGAKRFALQKFRPTRTLDRTFLREKTYSDNELAKIKIKLEKFIPVVIVR